MTDNTEAARAAFLGAGELLYPTENWQARYAGALGVPATRVRNVRRGKADLNRDGEKNRLLTDALHLAEHLHAQAVEELAAAQRRFETTREAVELLRSVKS